VKTLIHYLKVYKAFVSIAFAQALSFRLHFVLVAIMDVLFFASAVLSAEILFTTMPAIGFWDKDRFLFFVSFMLAVEQLHMTFIGEGFWELSEDIRTGNLDYKLLRPIGSIFVVVFSHVRAGTLFNFFLPWGFLIYYGLALNLSLVSWLLLPVLVIAGFTIQVLVEILVAIGMFWMIDGTALNFVRIQLQTISKWPDTLYQSYLKRFFTVVVPVLLIGSAPVHYLIDSSRVNLLIIMIGFLILLPILISFAWRQGLRKYESASS